MIKEIIVVEGTEDIRAVKAAVDAEVVATGGFWYGKKFINMLKTISKNRGIIILTDPDYAGEKIRRDLSNQIENVKHAYIPQGKSIKAGDIGVENASKEDIILALKKAKAKTHEKREEFTREELFKLGLMAGPGAKDRREELGEILGIGYANSKQLLSRLNSFGISRKEFEEAMERIVDVDE